MQDRSAEAAIFVDAVLLPFLRRCGAVTKPTVENIGALVWGFQIGRASELSLLEVGALLRRRIAVAEQAEMRNGDASVGDLVDALRLVHDTIPRVAVKFWATPRRPDR